MSVTMKSKVHSSMNRIAEDAGILNKILSAKNFYIHFSCRYSAASKDCYFQEASWNHYVKQNSVTTSMPIDRHETFRSS